MADKNRQRLRIIRLYKAETGHKEIDMHKVALFAVGKGWPLPRPVEPIDRLAKEFTEAAREEIRHDRKTGRPYRGQHAIWTKEGERQFCLWIDIDEDHPRRVVLKSLMRRREQTVGDLLQLSFDADHWNADHVSEEPIVIPCDLTDDVEWRKNGPDEKAG